MTLGELDTLRVLIERFKADSDYSLAHGLIALDRGDTVTYNRSLRRAQVTQQLYKDLEALLEVEIQDTLAEGVA